ncbi:DUF7283 family protein [Natrinema longum]|uniref:Uncharacterized protein n=1 Tax=Natrinema longum TaxID=370324 RepID=A0A8A2U8Y3_9EURY|nr:hypothetical protein [Natrinema longum]MBZ6493603.1 hypothetical protein [Natrinema longum]QSW85053.1 hypothetical protein J0X27_16650 [Natrinema longum]
MDFEAPVDGWYVHVAMVIASITFAGIALGIPSMPPPDAQRGANTIEGVTGSEYAASASYEHDAAVVTIDHETITMENEYGSSHARFAYGTVVPVNGYDRLENVTHGRSFEDEFGAELEDPHTDATGEFFALVEAADVENTGTELAANGEIVTRRVAVEEDSTVGIEAKATNNDALAQDLADEDDDLDEEDIEIPGTVRVRVDGTADSDTNVQVDGTELTETIDVDDSEGWFKATVTGFTCNRGGFWCDDTPDIDAIDYDFAPFPGLEEGDTETVTLVDGDLDAVTDSDEDEVTIWTGTYDLEITVVGADFEDCHGTIDEAGEWTEICGPSLTSEEFDDPHWHENRGGVRYVTLVTV